MVLDALKKRTTQDDIWHTLRTSKKAGVKNGLYIMAGCYKETPEEAQITADALRKACREGLIDYLNVFVMGVQAGTEMEQISKAEGWWIEPERNTVSMGGVRENGTPWMDHKEILDWRQVYKSSCQNPANTIRVTV